MEVREAVIHDGETRRVGTAEVGELNGSGFAGEDEEAVACGVAGQIDEDVDLIRADHVGKILIGDPVVFAPVVDEFFQSRCRRVSF